MAGARAAAHNYDGVAGLVAARVKATKGRISAKRLLPAAQAAGMAGRPATSGVWSRSRRRVAAKHHRGRRPAVWSPGEHLVIDWGAMGGLHVFCAVLAWSRVRFVRFAADERAETTLALLAECFEILGGVPGKVLADRMGCLKGGVVANVVVPTAEYVRFASHYGFRPDFCEAADPESKGMVENLVGYAKADLMVSQAPFGDLAAANAAARAWCTEVNADVHSEICAVPAARLMVERELLGPLPSLRASFGKMTTRKVDRLSCVRFASARTPSRPAHRRRSSCAPTTAAVASWQPRGSRRRARPGRPRARHRSATSITAARGQPRAGRSGRRAQRRRSSAPSARSLRRSSPAPPRPWHRLARELAELTPCAPRTADQALIAASTGPSRSAGGGPPTSARSWPPGAGRARPTGPPVTRSSLDLPAVPVRPLTDYAIGAAS